MNKKKLLKLKQEIVEKKASLSEHKGKKEVTLNNLKKNWNCNSLEEAQEKLNEIRISITDLKNKVENGIKKLQRQYDL